MPRTFVQAAAFLLGFWFALWLAGRFCVLHSVASIGIARVHCNYLSDT